MKDALPFDSAALASWQRRMSWSAREAAEQLGISYATYRDLIKGRSRTTGNPIEIDRRTQLACAALESGIGRANRVSHTSLNSKGP